MNLSKRQFLKLGMGGAAGLMLSQMLRPASLLASPAIVPAQYFDSSVHNYWMKMTYNRGQESRETRRIVGSVLRNMGATQGQGVGDRFAAVFDQAVISAYRNNVRPHSCLGLVQYLYNNYIFRTMGEAGGHVLFATLLAMLRGQDGTMFGDTVHHSYLTYRGAVLSHKDVSRTNNTQAILLWRKARTLALQDWQQKLATQVQFYSQRRGQLSPNFRVNIGMLAGFRPQIAHGPTLTIVKEGNHVVVSWGGPSRLQMAPTVKGPWSETNQSSPASFPITSQPHFFRTIHR
jgi:hypothetical protein